MSGSSSGARQDLARRDRVHEDAAAGEVDGELAREVDDAALDRAVRDVARRADHAVLRGDEDEPAARLADGLLPEHRAHGALAAAEDAGQADVEHRVPVVLAGLQEALRVRAGQHGVRHHHVEAPAELQRGVDQRVDVAQRPHVGLHEARRAARVRDQGVGRLAALARLAPDVADDDVRPLAGEGQAHRAAEAGRAAGDDDGAALEPPHRPAPAAASARSRCPVPRGRRGRARNRPRGAPSTSAPSTTTGSPRRSTWRGRPSSSRPAYGV